MRDIKHNIQRAIAAILTSALLLFGQAASLTSSVPVAQAAGLNIYVSASVVGPGAGTEADPYKTITSALAVATSGDTILVAPGTYNVANGEGFPISMVPGVALVGSGADVTTIAGDGTSQVISIQTFSTSTSTLVDGFRITGGATAAGSGIIIHDSLPTISNNIITGNSATFGGGIYINGESSPSIHDNIFEGNASTTGGGGIYCATSGIGSNPTIFNNTILANSGGTTGGGIAIVGCSPSVYDNVISGNSASVGGGLFFDDSSSSVFNNVVIGNSAVGGAFANGGAFFVDDATPAIFNNTICGNTADDSGGGIYNTGEGTFPIIFNCILWGNGDDLNGCVAAYSDIEDPDAGEGNIFDNPLFIGGGSYNLQSLSPCINSGAASFQGVSAPGSDILGTTRAQGTGFDMGAYEVPIPVPTLPYSGR